MNATPSPSVPFKLALGLGLIGALGPSAVDMYLSSLPEIASHYQASFTRVQLTLTFFLLAMGAGQLIFGPVVDAYGRRRPLLAGLLLFILCSLGAAMAPSLNALIALRFFQGLGSALTLVVIMSMVRDVSQGVAATKLFALLMTIEGVAPILAPALGGVIDAHFGWRAVMLVLAGVGLLVLLNTVLNLAETLPVERREPLRLGQACRTYLGILGDAGFLRPTLAVAAVFFFLFAYIGGATLVYQAHYGLTAQHFGLLFGATGMSVMVGALLASRLIGWLGLNRLSLVGVSCMALGALLTLLSAATGLGLPGVAGGMALALFGLGIAESTLMSLVMASQDTSLGSTAALLGAIQLSVASTASPLAALTLQHGPLAWSALLAVSALVVCLLTALSLRNVPASFSMSAH
ncbi:Bcr/CflA family efflux MFS transporter [Pseudomonas sp. S75]|uniref:Bcr/CflA family efflux MFS transporter n=1 Tax=unclassified Pseudomonas TaxID=196821 RepID=UPI001903C8F9|nr:MULTISPECIES: Bcr/CflA family efflux MFS transporter [unclassified Pseudomonas]MBJ9977620.1 Bcr/CflA family efflux MFS transporter [Pseudomonas sp. S30]MBK0154992.1 Bcr/CflA family efflux MFS transporter [Pseudomonas sp. S75]